MAILHVKVKFVLDLWFKSIFSYAFEDWENHVLLKLRKPCTWMENSVLQGKYQSANWTLITKREREREREILRFDNPVTSAQLNLKETGFEEVWLLAGYLPKAEFYKVEAILRYTSVCTLCCPRFLASSLILWLLGTVQKFLGLIFPFQALTEDRGHCKVTKLQVLIRVLFFSCRFSAVVEFVRSALTYISTTVGEARVHRHTEINQGLCLWHVF